MSIDLPLEIWAYIFAIRRYDFELLLFRFKKYLQFKIYWKLCLANDSRYIERYYTHYKSHYYPYNARVFKISRIIYSYRHVHRSGYCWGNLDAGILTFELRLPINWLRPSSTPEELLLDPMAPMYRFNSIWPTNFSVYSTGFSSL